MQWWYVFLVLFVVFGARLSYSCNTVFRSCQWVPRYLRYGRFSEENEGADLFSGGVDSHVVMVRFALEQAVRGRFDKVQKS